MIKGLAPQSPLLLSSRQLLSLPKKIPLEELEFLLNSYFGVKHNFLLSSGRACLFFILKTLRELAGENKDKVIIPAYTCPSVPYTIKKAGFHVLLCNVKTDAFSLDVNHLENLIDDRVLAFVPTHLFGIPCKMARVREIAASKGIFIVEDFSHAIGARLDGKNVGTFGDVSFSSLGRGKMLTTHEGGIILTSSENISRLLRQKILDIKKVPRKRKSWIILQLILLYFIITKNKWGFIKNSPLDPEKRERPYRFKVSLLTNFQISLLKKSFDEMNEINLQRKKRAQFLEEELRTLQGIELPVILDESDPVFMMFPIIFEDKEKMKGVYGRLRKRGYGASRMYKSSLNVILKNDFYNNKDNFSQTEYMTEMLMTLPCHPYISLNSLEKIIEVMKKDLH